MVNDLSCYVSETVNSEEKKNEIVGSCGPCSWINLLQLRNPDFELEKRLYNSGRLIPSKACDYTSFLVWAKESGLNIDAYVASKSLNTKVQDLMVAFEQVSNPANYRMQLSFKRIARNAKFPLQIHKVDDPSKVLDKSLENGSRVATVISTGLVGHPDWFPHWSVAYDKKGSTYSFLDSEIGKVEFSREDLEKAWAKNLDLGFGQEVVVYKP